MTLEANLDVVRAGNRALAAHDIDGILESIRPDFKLNIILQPRSLMPPQGIIINGDMMREMLARLFAVIPDCALEEVDVRATNKSVYVEIVLYGTHRGTITLPTGATIPPSCQRIQIPLEVYSIFDEAGELVGSTCYASLSDVLKQAGIDETLLEA